MKITTPHDAYEYCVQFGQNEEMEKIISKDYYWSLMYAKNVIQTRFILGETELVKSPAISLMYTKLILNGQRFILAEELHISNKRWYKEYLHCFNEKTQLLIRLMYD